MSAADTGASSHRRFRPPAIRMIAETRWPRSAEALHHPRSPRSRGHPINCERQAVMIVSDIAKFDVTACGPDTDLATAAQIMWDCDCGVVPVVNEDRKLLGIV